MNTSAQRSMRTYSSTPGSARAARAFVMAELRREEASVATVDDLGLIVSELVANAIQHGDGGDIVVSVDVEPGAYAATVGSGIGDTRPPMNPATWTVASADQPSGRGLGIIRQLADEITVTLAPGRLDITCRRR